MTGASTIRLFRDQLLGGKVHCRRGRVRHRTPRQSFGHASQRRKSVTASRPLSEQWGRSHQLNASPTRGDYSRTFSAAALAALSA